VSTVRQHQGVVACGHGPVSVACQGASEQAREGKIGAPGLDAMTAFLNLLHLPIINLPEIVRIPGQECGLGQHGRRGDVAVRRFQAV
jgi:hypothetical protein